MLVLLLSVLLNLAVARDNTPALTAAQAWAGTPYLWGGRGTSRNPGMDCLGILFRAYGKVDGVSWTVYPVNPSELVASGRLGRPVEGLAGVKREQIARHRLEVGDVLYFLLEEFEIPDAPLLVEGERRFWPWHTALYAGAGQVLHAAPGSVVKTQALDEMPFDRLFVTRPGT